MAARFAVTTGNWTGAIWAATSGGAAGSAAVPINADDATINKNVVVTIDDTTAVCLSLTLSPGTTGADVGGKLKASTTAHSKLTVEGSITATGATGGGGTYSSFVELDQSGSAFNFDLVVNNVRATGAGNGLTLDGNFTIKGKVRTRHTLTTGALTANSSTSVGVVDATGWAVGDQLVFATTQAYNATPRTDKVTIATITPGTPPAATITWTDGAGTGGAVAFDHATACVVGNFSSNLIFRGNTAGDVSWVKFTQNTGELSQNAVLSDVLISGFSGENVLNSAFMFSMNSNITQAVDISNNAFWDHRQNCLMYQTAPVNFTRSNNIFYSENQADNRWAMNAASSQASPIGPDADFAIFRGKCGINIQIPGQQPMRGQISGLVQAGSSAGIGAMRSGVSPMTFTDCDVWACNTAFPAYGVNTLVGGSLGTKYGGAINNTVFLPNSATVEAIDCDVQSTGTFLSGITTLPSYTEIAFVNKNGDPAVQEIYRNHSNTVPVIQRVTDTINRSTSSVLMTCNASTAVEHAFEVLAKAGETIRIIGFVRKSGTPAYGASTLPKITISGLGITPVVATMSGGTAADTWEQLTLDATNSGSSDGLLTVTFTAQSATAGAKAWFSGIPVAPFVSRCRHYGYTFDETNPVRMTNITVSASESTAAAYTGMAVTWGASSSSVAVTSSNTLQKLYDYTQAQGCLNVGSAMPLTGAGVAGAPALFAAGDITVSDGVVLNGTGSLSMGGFTLLATEFSSGENYTYTGGTWGQLSNSPTFAGGTLNLGAAATYAFATTGDIILSMTPTAPSTYAMASVTATGELDLRNTTAHAITVELSSEAAALAITSNNTGGTITISAPQVYQQVPITNITTTSRVQIYDESAIAPVGDRELYNDIPGATSVTWTDPLPAVATRDIRVRITDVVGASAKEMIESSIGTCGITEETKSVSYRASQVNDDVYIANAIDGSAVTDITIDDTEDVVKIAISGGGSKSWPQIYAYQVYWLDTEAGIRDDFAFIEAPDTANYRITGFKIRNDDASPLVLTGGYGVDATTGDYIDVIDTAGSTGNIFPDVAHVVAKIVTVGGANIITGDIADIPEAVATAVTGHAKTLTVSKFIGLK